MTTSDESHPVLVLLKSIFVEIGSANATIRESGLSRLRSFIEDEGVIRFSASQHMSSQSKVLQQFIGAALTRLFQSADSRVGGVLAINELLHVDFCDPAGRTLLFSKLLLSAVVDASPVVLQAVGVWGKLLSKGHRVFNDFVEAEHCRAVDMLGSGHSSEKRLAGCLVIQELIVHAPSFVLPSASQTAMALCNATTDPLRSTRERAAVALERLLDMSLGSGADLHRHLLDRLLEVALRSWGQKPTSAQHAGWLIFITVLKVKERHHSAPINKALMHTAWGVVRQNLHKMPPQPELRRGIHQAISLMATNDRELFLEQCVGDVLTAAVQTFRSTTATNDDKHQMFLMIGRLGAVLPERIYLYIHRLMLQVEEHLVPCKKPKRERCDGAVVCLTLLAEASPAAVRPYVPPLMDAIFAGALTVEFAANIASLCRTYSEIRITCLENMLRLAQQQLQSVPLRYGLVADPRGTKVLDGTFAALRLLSYSGFPVLDFLLRHVTNRFWDPEKNVRRSATELCACLMHCCCDVTGSPCRTRERGAAHHCGSDHLLRVLQVQQCLIAVAVSDRDPDVRLHILQLFTEQFAQTVASADCVGSLLAALNDKHQNRCEAIRVLGYAARFNPAVVHPALRKTLMQCVLDVDCFEDLDVQNGAEERRLEQAIVIMDSVVGASPKLAQAYRPVLLSRIVRLMSGVDLRSAVLRALLSCIENLVQHCGEADIARVREVRPFVVQHIINGSSGLRREAIRALGCIVRATRDINLYSDFPRLLPSLLSMLHGTFKEVWAVRQDTLALPWHHWRRGPGEGEGYYAEGQGGSGGGAPAKRPSRGPELQSGHRHHRCDAAVVVHRRSVPFGIPGPH